MYRIMIAEDEPEVLGAMLSTIDWNAHGFEAPAGCRDGRVAIERIEEGYEPDALITDICMPFVDGLELTRYINRQLPNTIVVVLTGYDDFKYAQKAIKLQVYDYLLKPITPGRINELTDQLREELDRRRIHNIEDSMKITGGYFLNLLITRRLDENTIEENCRAHEFSFSGRYHAAATIDLDLPAPSTVDESGNLELMRYGLCNIAQELAEDYPNALVFQGNDGTAKLIVSANDRDELYERITGLARTVSATAGGGLGIPVSAGIGEPVAYLDELHLSHAQSLTALSYRFFYGEGSVICETDVDIKKSQEIDYPSCERAFETAVRTLDRAGAQAAVTELIDQLRDSHIAFDRCVLYSQKLIMSLIGITGEIVGEHEIDELEKTWEHANFYAVPTISRLGEMVEMVCDKAFGLLELVRSDTAASQVIKAEKYIRDCYSNPELSLNMITEHLSISTSYFSAIFKSKTGSTFVEYLTRVRMEKAKQILAFTDRRTYEAAEDVGFSDPHYFSVAFKRVTGMTPKEYRERGHARDQVRGAAGGDGA